MYTAHVCIRGYYLGVYGGLGTSQSLCVLCAYLLLAVGSVLGSRALHSHMLHTILRAPMSFFDTTPLGRILNRFSEDVYTIDEVIPMSLAMCLDSLFIVASTVVVIVIATPTFLVMLIPVGIFYLCVQVMKSSS